ncbi:hypothetical protein FRC04_010418 [Tulasnella sp. 424]|nr:hypothetical protein FRC04_010418 [Tulasnella sp. 424]
MAVPRRAAQYLTSSSRIHVRGYADAPTWVATQHTLRVAPWDGFKSMPHVYATARELEKRFGPVNHIKVPRDPETHSYRGYAWITFREPLPVNEEGGLPKELQDMVVKKPTNDVDRPGGPGLDDFAGLLESGSKRPESEWTKLKDAQDATSTGSAYLDVRLELSTDSLKLKPTRARHLSAELEKSIARSFDMFTGFADEPTSTMEAARKRWSKHLPPKPAPSKASSSRQAGHKHTKKTTAADELPQMDPLADYLEAYKDLKPEEPQAADPLFTSRSQLSEMAEADSQHPIQAVQAQKLLEVQENQKEEAAPAGERTEVSGTSQSHMVAEPLPQGIQQPNQRNAHPAQAAASRKKGTPARTQGQQLKPSRKDALLAAARHAGKKAAAEKLKPKNTEKEPTVESSSPEEEHQETERDSRSEPSAGLPSRIFSMFKRS